MLMPLGMTIMTRAAGPDRIGRVMAVLGVPMLLGPIVGPILGGWLIEVASWHWIFLINLPIGIVALDRRLAGAGQGQPDPVGDVRLRRHAAAVPGPRAVPVRRLLASRRRAPIASAQVLIPAVDRPAADRRVRVPRAAPKDHPLIDLHLFKRKQLSRLGDHDVAVRDRVLRRHAAVPDLLHQVRGESTLAAGLLLAPQGLGAMLTMPIAGRLTDKMGPGKFVLGGLALIAVGMGVFTQLTDTTSYVLILGSLFVMGLGMGMTMMPIMTAALATLSTTRGRPRLDTDEHRPAGRRRPSAPR